MVNNYKVIDVAHKELCQRTDKMQSVLFYFSLSVNRSAYSVYDVLIKTLAESQVGSLQGGRAQGAPLWIILLQFYCSKM